MSERECVPFWFFGQVRLMAAWEAALIDVERGGVGGGGNLKRDITRKVPGIIARHGKKRRRVEICADLIVDDVALGKLRVHEYISVDACTHTHTHTHTRLVGYRRASHVSSSSYDTCILLLI